LFTRLNSNTEGPAPTATKPEGRKKCGFNRAAGSVSVTMRLLTVLGPLLVTLMK
jgi:hypothetical protein